MLLPLHGLPAIVLRSAALSLLVPGRALSTATRLRPKLSVALTKVIVALAKVIVSLAIIVVSLSLLIAWTTLPATLFVAASKVSIDILKDEITFYNIIISTNIYLN